MKCAFLVPLVLSAALFAQQSATPAAAAPDQPSRADVLHLFTAMRLQQQMESTQNVMAAQVPQMIEKGMDEDLGKLTPAQHARIQELSKSSMQDALRMYPVSEMLDDMVPVYQHNLSKADIDAIASFYTSPAGQKLLDKGAQMMQDTMAVIMPKMQQRMQQSVDLEKQKMEEILTTPPGQEKKPSSVTPH
jgi:uncharacterized protein